MNANQAALTYTAAALSLVSKELRTLLSAFQGSPWTPSEAFYEQYSNLSIAISSPTADISLMLQSVLSIVDITCALIVPETLAKMNVYVRKAEAINLLPSLQPEVAQIVADYEGLFIPFYFIGSCFSIGSRCATVVSTEGIISQSVLLNRDHRVLHIGSAPPSELQSELPTHIKIVKEYDMVIVKEGPNTSPLAKVKLKEDEKYPLRSGLLFYIGSALLTVHSVSQEAVRLRWKLENQPYSPMIQFAAAVKPRWLVGRQPDSDILLSEKSVSSRHVLFECSNGQWTICDLRSTNGTFRYLHTMSSLSHESDELLVTGEETVYLEDKTSLWITLDSA